MAGINKLLSIITLNVNYLNYPIKRHRLAEWIKKQDPIIMFAKDLPYSIDSHRLKVKG